MSVARKRGKIGDLVWREVRGALRLAPWILASLLLVVLWWQPDLTAAGGLFQSPQDTPTPTIEPTATPELEPSATPTLESVPPTATSEAPPTDVPAPQPTETPALAITPTMVPTNSPTPTLVPTETPVSPTPTTLPSTLTSTPAPGADGEGERYATEDSNLLFDWKLLFDSVALGLSYVWLCCGGLIIVSIVIFFVVLWISARKRQKAGDE